MSESYTTTRRKWNLDPETGRSLPGKSLAYVHRGLIWRVVRDHPGCTQAELGRLVDVETKHRGVPRVGMSKLDRRLHDLEERGAVRREQPGSSKWARWFVVPHEERPL